MLRQHEAIRGYSLFWVLTSQKFSFRMYVFGAVRSMPPLASGSPRHAAFFKALYGRPMQSAQLLFHQGFCIAPSIRDLASFVFGSPKCVEWHQNVDHSRCVSAQYGRLIALINQLSAFFDQLFAVFAPFGVAPGASCGTSALWSRRRGWS